MSSLSFVANIIIVYYKAVMKYRRFSWYFSLKKWLIYNLPSKQINHILLKLSRLLFPDSHYYASIFLKSFLTNYIEPWNHLINNHFNLTLSCTNSFAPSVFYFLLFWECLFFPTWFIRSQWEQPCSHTWLCHSSYSGLCQRWSSDPN